MVRRRPDLPAGHGELVAEPPVSEWAGMARANAATASSWDFAVAGVSAGDLRRQARRELVAVADGWTTRLGIDAASPPVDPEFVIATGHQPDLYHTGVWAKDFLLQRVAEQTDATAIDIVVDSDTFSHVGVSAPCFKPGVARCRQYLALGGPDASYASTPVPDHAQIELFCEATSSTLDSLPAPAVRRHFAAFCECLREAAPRSSNVAELITSARRCYEGDLTDYLELPITAAVRSESFARFTADICLSAARFAEAHNEELAAYRSLNRVRSSAQPFSDLEVGPDGVEVPFWLLAEGSRLPVRVREGSGGSELVGPNGALTILPDDPHAAQRALREMEHPLVPRALTLTLFFRTFLADLFIHGIGGARYDRVTDALARRWWGIELPPYVTASLTMYLPLGAYTVTEEDLSAVDQRLHRLAHNPDEVLGEVEFDSSAERERALALAEEKRSLVEEISAEGADRKALGIRIREVNVELATLLEPLAEEFRATRERLESQLEAGGILADRTYPFCLWSPQEVADKTW